MDFKKLIESKELLKHPDFDIKFIFREPYTQDNPWSNIRSFTSIVVDDVGHSDKIIVFGKDEV